MKNTYLTAMQIPAVILGQFLELSQIIWYHVREYFLPFLRLQSWIWFSIIKRHRHCERKG